MALDVLLLFIKNPELGKVKTRLAKDLGDSEALSVYLRLVAHTRNQSLEVDVARRLYYSDGIDNEDDWNGDDFYKYIQEGDDLGARMSNAFRRAFFDGARKVVIIGSDCAELSSDILNQAFEALDGRDMVAGPANDGGYYLLGMRKFYPEVFRNIEWSTSSVLADTMAIARGMNLSVKVLDTLVDVDTLADWEKVKNLI
jgi:hypothetical protein